MLEARPRGTDVPKSGLVMGEERRRLDGFVLDKEKSSFKLAMPILVKFGDPFLRIRKKKDPSLDLRARR